MNADPRQVYFSTPRHLELTVRRVLALAEEYEADLTFINRRREFPFEFL